MFFVLVGSQVATSPTEALAARQLLTFPAAYQITLSLVISIGGLLAVTYAAAVAGSEWSWGTFKNAVARGEGRGRYLLLLFAAVTIATWVGLVVAFLVGVAVTAAGALVTGVGLAGMADTEALLALPERFARAGLAMAMNASLGFAIATLTRSQLAGVGVGIGLFFAEGIAGIFAPHVIKWFPFTASGAAVEGGAGGSVVVNGAEIGASLDSTTAIVVTVLWLVGALVVAVVRAERAEISG
jgi:ABC-2 type transport system permease protein